MKNSIYVLFLVLIIVFSCSIGSGENINVDIDFHDGIEKERIEKVNGNFLNVSESHQLKIVWNVYDPYDPDQGGIRTVDLLFKDKTIASFAGEHVYYEGLCLDQQTKLHNLIFISTSPFDGNVGDIAFIHYDKNLKSFQKTIFENQIIDSLTRQLKDQRICLWRENYNKQINLLQIYEQIRVNNEETNFEKEIQKKQKYKKFTLTTKIVDDKTIDNLKQSNSIETKTILKNKKWTVKVIKNFGGGIGQNNWGVLIAKQQGNDFWTSFYNIPSGLSKVLLYDPKNIGYEDTPDHLTEYLSENLTELIKKQPLLKTEDIFTAYFCTECTLWGEWDIFNVELGKWNVFYLNYNNREPLEIR